MQTLGSFRLQFQLKEHLLHGMVLSLPYIFFLNYGLNFIRVSCFCRLQIRFGLFAQLVFLPHLSTFYFVKNKGDNCYWFYTSSLFNVAVGVMASSRIWVFFIDDASTSSTW